MDIDNKQFEDDEERRRYLAQLARLKKYREESFNSSPQQPEDYSERMRFGEIIDHGSYDFEVHMDDLEDLEDPDDLYAQDTQNDQFFRELEKQREELRRRERLLEKRERQLREEERQQKQRKQKQQKQQKQERQQKQQTYKAERRERSEKKDSSQKYSPRRQRLYDEYEEYQEYQEEEKPKKKCHPVLIIILILLLLAIAFFAYKYFFAKETGHYTVAVFGLDSRNGNVGKEALSDVNIIADVNKETGEVRLVSVYRDTYVQINQEGTYHKFNEAYFRGGPEQAVWTMEHNLDVHIDDYAAFNWKAVVDTINILGGVDVEITDAEFKYINAFITETVNSTGVGSYQLEHAGMNHLDGVQAVAYARLRLMDTDFQRTERQRKIISLAFEKAKNSDFATINCIMETVLPQINTSVTLNDLIPFGKNISKYHLAETAGYPFEKTTMDVGKLDCVVAVTLETNAVALHQFLWPETEYTPSQALIETSNRIINETGLGASDNPVIKTDDFNDQAGNTSSDSQVVPQEPEPAAPAENQPQPETEVTEEPSPENTEDESTDEEEYINPTEKLPNPLESDPEESGLSNPPPEDEGQYEDLKPGSETATPEETEKPASEETLAGSLEIIDMEE